jgi:putative transposase
LPRAERKKSKNGIYHIMLRGINRQDIFEDDEDREKFLETLKRYKEISRYEVYSYCLMSNHIHLLLAEKEEPLSLIIKRISGSYVYWYNKKYKRCGHLFQDRFKSENVDDERYFLTVVNYIHQNPVKAGMSKTVAQYKWSSYPAYLIKEPFINSDFLFELLSTDPNKVIEAFLNYTNNVNSTQMDKCLDYEDNFQLTDLESKDIFHRIGFLNVSDLQNKDKSDRDMMLRAMKNVKGVSIRQISRITSISKSVIERA